MIYSADMGMKKLAGIRIDPGTGKLEAAFVLDNLTSTLQPVLGPADKRVLLLTNMKLSLAIEPLMLALKKANRATDVARCGNGQDPGGIGFFRAPDDQLVDPAGLRRPRLFPYRDRQGFLHAASDARTGSDRAGLRELSAITNDVLREQENDHRHHCARGAAFALACGTTVAGAEEAKLQLMFVQTTRH